MSMFATTANENYDGLSIPSLEPGKYTDCILEDVKYGATTKKTGETGKNIITFTFVTPEGSRHQNTEYEVLPTDKDSDKKAKNMLKRIGHIMSKFVPKERLVQSAQSFAEYGNWVVATIKSVPFKDQKVDILITGNVWDGKATADFTGYPPFIAKAGEALQFDNNGLKANAEYAQFKAKQVGVKPDTDGGTPAASGMYNTDQTAKADF